MARPIDKKTRTKAWILLVLVLIAMCIPMRTQQKSGTVTYRAVVWSLTRLHEPAVEEHRMGLRTGEEWRIFGHIVHSSVVFTPDDIATTIAPAGEEGTS